MQRSPAAFSPSLVFFLEAVKINCVTIKEAATCNASLQALCNGACVKTPTLLAIKQLRKITFYLGSQKMILINYVCDAM